LRISQANNDDDIAFRVSAFEFNLFGRNQIIGGFYSRDVFDSFGIFWEAPFLFTNKFGFGINYQDNVTFEPIFANDDAEAVDYRFQNTTFQASLIYEFNFHNRGEFGFILGTQEYDQEVDQPELGLPNALDADNFSIFGEYEYNDLDIFYQYISGFRNLSNARYVFNDGGQGFLEDAFVFTNDFEYYLRVGKRGNWASRLRSNFTTNVDSPFAPFALDNQINIRGVGNTVDRGTASTPGNEFNQLFDGSSVRFFPGLGLRFIHKRIFNAVIRLDYGFGIGNDTTNGLVFGIGLEC